MSARFIIQERVERPPLYRPAPAVAEHGWLRFGDMLGTAVYLSDAVIDDLVRWARSASPRETMGLLAGRPCEDADGPFTLVTGAVRAERAEAGRTHVFADVGEMADLVGDIRWGWPIAEVVGWWHTHPGYGTRFSSTDEETQATFTAVHSIGVVIDPTLPVPCGMGVYLGPRSGPITVIDAPPVAVHADHSFVSSLLLGGHRGSSPSR